MSKATESMFDGKNVLIPLAEVSYILKFQNCIEVRFKDSTEPLTLVQPDKNAFISAWCRYRGEVEADTLMDLDGAQPKLDEIKIALHRALELGKRETWTGAKKYRSREDQCEEQQCWDKVWNLLGAKGE